MDVVDVAIAGGGPGGLATAAALIAAFKRKASRQGIIWVHYAFVYYAFVSFYLAAVSQRW